MTCFVVLGMHRSGTSLTASMLKEMGVDMGKQFIVGDSNNPNGYYEDIDWLQVNKDILIRAGGDWKSIVTRKDVLGAIPDSEEQINAVIDKKNIPGKKWGFKDPRTCITIWAYHARLTNPRFIVVSRNMPGIISSLNRAHGKGNWVDLVKHYNAHVVSFLDLHPYPVHYMNYDHIIDGGYQSYATISGLCSFVGTTAPFEKLIGLIKPAKK